MSKTTIKMTATLTVVTEMDSELYKLSSNPDWQSEVIKLYQGWAKDELNDSFESARQTAHFNNFKFEVSTDEGN